ncbi:MAG TPA: magnesium and cobalt transport protein CorA [Thermoleophilaceae bacterium]|nr:magnesium and cobalt transport protein CorA [Thermoleophilaceae bacterium]
MIVDRAIYRDGVRQDDGSAPPGDGAFVWIGVHEPTAKEFDGLAREFDLPPLAVEDAIEAHERPKLDVYDDMLFLVVKTARYVDPQEVVEIGELLIFAGPDYLITVRHGEGSSLKVARQALEGDPERMRSGPSAALHAILDQVVDDYMPAIEGLENDIDEVEEQLFSERRLNLAERIYRLQREVLEFRRAVTPLIDPVEELAGGRYKSIHPGTRDYFGDIRDHLARARDQLDGQRDLLAGSLQANLAQVGVRQNEDMRRISAWVAIIAVPTAIAGIYGMNFDHMPELRWELGYPAALLVMVSICAFLYARFKRAGWL